MERRRYKRYALTVPVIVTDKGGFQAKAAGVNVSAGGMRLIFDPEMTPQHGELYKLEFTLPGRDQPVVVESIVRWVDRIMSHECGVAFTTGLRAIDVWALNQLGD